MMRIYRIASNSNYKFEQGSSMISLGIVSICPLYSLIGVFYRSIRIK